VSGCCDQDAKAIAYVLLRTLADSPSTRVTDSGRLHEAAAILRRFEP
jgi:hypothetical protein